MKELHILNQLRFARSEFQRGFEGVSEEDSRRRFMPINSIAWIVGHLAWHEQHYWLKRAQGIIPFPRLDEVTAFWETACGCFIKGNVGFVACGDQRVRRLFDQIIKR